MNPSPTNNATRYQAEKREETLNRIDEAIKYLRSAHIKVSKTRIAEEAGLSHSTMNKPHVQAYLQNFEEFTVPQSHEKKQLTPEAYEARIASLTNRLKISQNKNKRLELQLKAVREENAKLQDEYEYLAGAYQRDCSKKTIVF